MIVWVRLAALLFAVSFRDLTVDTSVSALFFSGGGLTFLMILTMVGAIIAALVFAISVVSIPMMLDRKIDFVTAVLTLSLIHIYRFKIKNPRYWLFPVLPLATMMTTILIPLNLLSNCILAGAGEHFD